MDSWHSGTPCHQNQHRGIAVWQIAIALVLQADSIPSKSVCYPTSAGSLCVAELPQRSKPDIKPTLPPPLTALIDAVTWTCCSRFSSIVNRFSWHFMSAIFYSIPSRYLHCKLSNVLIYEIPRDNISNYISEPPPLRWFIPYFTR